MTGVIKFTSNRVWRTYPGGKLLDAIENNDTPQDSHFPEDWIGSTVQANNVGREHIAEGLTMVINDAGEQVSFKDLLLSNPDYYLGEFQGRTRQIDDIPLVKYLDSATRLHFQVHPSSDFAQQRLGAPRGKTEAYVILAVRDDVEVSGRIYRQSSRVLNGSRSNREMCFCCPVVGHMHWAKDC